MKATEAWVLAAILGLLALVMVCGMQMHCDSRGGELHYNPATKISTCETEEAP
jgi:hypothetical protein